MKNHRILEIPIPFACNSKRSRNHQVWETLISYIQIIAWFKNLVLVTCYPGEKQDNFSIQVKTLMPCPQRERKYEKLRTFNYTDQLESMHFTDRRTWSIKVEGAETLLKNLTVTLLSGECGICLFKWTEFIADLYKYCWSSYLSSFFKLIIWGRDWRLPVDIIPTVFRSGDPSATLRLIVKVGRCAIQGFH